nr:MAG TPA: hypothetical protein [Caudoviricetes sp.]
MNYGCMRLHNFLMFFRFATTPYLQDFRYTFLSRLIRAGLSR